LNYSIINWKNGISRQGHRVQLDLAYNFNSRPKNWIFCPGIQISGCPAKKIDFFWSKGRGFLGNFWLKNSIFWPENLIPVSCFGVKNLGFQLKITAKPPTFLQKTWFFCPARPFSSKDHAAKWKKGQFFWAKKSIFCKKLSFGPKFGLLIKIGLLINKNGFYSIKRVQKFNSGLKNWIFASQNPPHFDRDQNVGDSDWQKINKNWIFASQNPPYFDKNQNVGDSDWQKINKNWIFASQNPPLTKKGGGFWLAKKSIFLTRNWKFGPKTGFRASDFPKNSKSAAEFLAGFWGLCRNVGYPSGNLAILAKTRFFSIFCHNQGKRFSENPPPSEKTLKGGGFSLNLFPWLW
jgi:hypothetical protein